MILYSIIPYDVVFSRQDDVDNMRPFEIDYHGQRVEVTVDKEGRYKINRIISTSPSDYLDPKFQPGMNIPLT